MFLIGSVITISLGIIFWKIVGPVIMLSGVKVVEDSFPALPWLSNPNSATLQVFEATPAYWAGLVLTILGFSVCIAGIIGFIISFLLEYIDKNRTRLRNV